MQRKHPRLDGIGKNRKERGRNVFGQSIWGEKGISLLARLCVRERERDGKGREWKEREKRKREKRERECREADRVEY